MSTIPNTALAVITGGQLVLPSPPSDEEWWNAIVAGLNAQDAAARWAEWYVTYGANQQ